MAILICARYLQRPFSCFSSWKVDLGKIKFYIKLLIITETLIKRDSLLDLLVVNERSKKWSGGYWSEAVMNDRRNSQHIAL